MRRHAALLLLAALAGAPALAETRAGEKAVAIGAIDGVVAAGAPWALVWSGTMTADGIVGTNDGGLLFAQEQSDSVHKIGPDGKDYVYLGGLPGVGAVSIDAKGRVFAVLRTCTDPGLHRPACPDLTRVVEIAPDARILATGFADGRPLGRLNDLIADGRGGAWFTVGGLYHAAADGTVSVVAEGSDIATNGLALSPDGRTLYVTNRDRVVAFDVRADGSTANRRDFVVLPGETRGADGLAVDAAGRLYVTGEAGVHVIAQDGKYLGLIPVPRRPISIAFSGAGRQDLFVATMGAVGPDGAAWTTPEGVRNVAMTIYRVRTIAAGVKGRPK